MQIVGIKDAQHLPFWRRPVFLLLVFAFTVPIAFNTWMALLNNFVIEKVGFTGIEIGWLHTVREIPGLLSVGVIGLLVFIREQLLGLVALALLGVASAVTAWFPSLQGLLVVTMLSSLGFHYFETVNQSLQLQWIDKKRAPQVLGWIVAIGSGASLLSYGLLVLTWKAFDLSYNFVYLVSGGFVALVAVFCYFAFPQFESTSKQKVSIVLRRRYWLFYALQFIVGARRQIFMVFAAFMMVEKFGFEVHEVTALLMLNFLANLFIAPFIGKAVAVWGERRALLVEYSGLTLVFLAYGGIYFFGWGVVLAATLYVLDHILFALALALKTYFQKIADPQDIAPTAAVAFTINHIAAVALPGLLGYLWVTSPGAVFILAAAMAATSLGLAFLIPRHPEKGRETIFSRGVRTVAE